MQHLRQHGAAVNIDYVVGNLSREIKSQLEKSIQIFLKTVRYKS